MISERYYYSEMVVEGVRNGRRLRAELPLEFRVSPMVGEIRRENYATYLSNQFLHSFRDVTMIGLKGTLNVRPVFCHFSASNLGSR